MPNKDRRTIAAAKKGKMPTSGRMTVSYRDVKGRSRDAVVRDAGSSSGLKLQLVDTGQIIDNVALATGLKQTNVYHYRSVG